jgi:hypothetical protein
MTGDQESDLTLEERVERILRRQPRDLRIASFTAVEARLRRGTSLPFVLISAASVVVFALTVGSVLAERRAATPAASPTYASSAATPSTSGAAVATTPSPRAASILSDRFGFVWVEEPNGLQIRAESGASVSSVAALPYGFNRCGCKVSPDGMRLAYWTTRTRPDNIELRVLDLTRPTQSTTVYKAPPDHRIGAAAWSSDGTGILIALEGIRPPGPPVANPPNTSLLIIDAGGGVARTLDAGAGVYVPLGWDRAAGVASAAISGEGGFVNGIVTARTVGEPLPKRTVVEEPVLALSLDVSDDQRYVLAVFLQVGKSGGVVRWWKLSDYATQMAGPSVDSPSGAKWRPGTAEIGWLESGTLGLLDVSRGTKRSGGAFPAADYVLAAFRHDGSAAVGLGSSGMVLLEVASGRSEKITGSGSIGGAIRLP